MVRRLFYILATTSIVTVGTLSLWWPQALLSLIAVGPIIGLGIHDVVQTQSSLRRNYPVIGRIRYLFEAFRPEIQQYFVESDTDGTPFTREQRSVVYQRAKGMLQTVPFGTQQDVYRNGFEAMRHSMSPRPAAATPPRITIGGPACSQPYEAAHLNISAMSYGSLSKNAVLALNRGAKEGGFWHNTGEGGISEHHLVHGGDLVWQIGTGYFGCRDAEGRFSPDRFAEHSAMPSVKMIEIKLSQGAKPAHGGILPAAKVTREIAAIRGVPMAKDVLSPPGHSEFSTPTELLGFVSRLRNLSGGKPVGFKLCIGDKTEFLSVCKAILDTGISPDFITVDGAEGGTGAAPLEFANSVGTPLREALLFVHNSLVATGLRRYVRIVASGKIVTGFDMIRAFALGADVCNSARGMMLALGCIQARRCNDNSCPVGIATTNARLGAAVHVAGKAARVRRFQHDTVHSMLELIGAVGLQHPNEIAGEHVWRRIGPGKISDYADIHEYLAPGSLVDGSAPRSWLAAWDSARADRFAPVVRNLFAA